MATLDTVSRLYQVAHTEVADLAAGAETIGGGLYLFGWSLTEATGTAVATVNIYDGTDASGPAVCDINLNPGQSTRDWFGPHGVHFRGGLHLVVSAGSATGSVFWTPAPPQPRVKAV